MMSLKSRFDPHKLQREAQKMLRNHPERVPVILENNNRHPIRLDKNKYLAPRDISLGQFMTIIRKRSKINENEALFIFFNNQLVPNTTSMGEIYEQHKDPQSNFLIATVSAETTFG